MAGSDGPKWMPDAGWLFVLAGVVMCAACLLLPAEQDLAEVQEQYSELEFERDHIQSRLARQAELLEALDDSDADLIRRLAAQQLNRIPDGEEAVILARYASASLGDRIETAVGSPIRVPTTERSVSLLERLAAGRARLWVLGASMLSIFVGLILSPGRPTEVDDHEEADNATATAMVPDDPRETSREEASGLVAAPPRQIDHRAIEASADACDVEDPTGDDHMDWGYAECEDDGSDVLPEDEPDPGEVVSHDVTAAVAAEDHDVMAERADALEHLPPAVEGAGPPRVDEACAAPEGSNDLFSGDSAVPPTPQDEDAREEDNDNEPAICSDDVSNDACDETRAIQVVDQAADAEEEGGVDVVSEESIDRPGADESEDDAGPVGVVTDVEEDEDDEDEWEYEYVYEYTDEDGNPIDAEDLGDDYEIDDTVEEETYDEDEAVEHNGNMIDVDQRRDGDEVACDELLGGSEAGDSPGPEASVTVEFQDCLFDGLEGTESDR